ncbi:hypothetical protein MKEN_00991700 [Mycena kentingensis (nom. inval.)]|nr:hypothetical protein MKEN_00991700 [Mycena kentingensis (nom. inval.)]
MLSFLASFTQPALPLPPQVLHLSTPLCTIPLHAHLSADLRDSQAQVRTLQTELWTASDERARLNQRVQRAEAGLRTAKTDLGNKTSQVQSLMSKNALLIEDSARQSEALSDENYALSRRLGGEIVRREDAENALVKERYLRACKESDAVRAEENWEETKRDLAEARRLLAMAGEERAELRTKVSKLNGQLASHCRVVRERTAMLDDTTKEVVHERRMRQIAEAELREERALYAAREQRIREGEEALEVKRRELLEALERSKAVLLLETAGTKRKAEDEESQTRDAKRAKTNSPASGWTATGRLRSRAHGSS